MRNIVVLGFFLSFLLKNKVEMKYKLFFDNLCQMV